MKTYIKDPDDVLDYTFDFAALENGTGDTNWLDRVSSPVDTISTKTITAEAGITVDSSSITDSSTSVTVWLSGGTEGETYTVTCQIVTANGRTKDKSIKIKMVEQ